MKILVATLGHSADDDRIYHKQIRSLLKGGHQVTLVTRNKPQASAKEQDFRHIDLRNVSLVQFGSQLHSLAEQWQPQALQIHEFELLVAGGRIKQSLGIPLIYDVQDPHQEMWDAFSSKPPVIKHMINWGLLRFEKMHLKHVDCVCALSPLIARRYAEWGLKIMYVPNYPPLIPLEKTIPREPVVIYQGQISPERGIWHAIQAFQGVIEKVPGAKLDIYGSERIRGLIDQMKEKINQTGLDHAIAVKPPVSYERILRRLQEVQIGLIPFTDKPLFHVLPPNKLYEYMMCGCAVVASDLPILRELGKDRVLYVTPGDVDALTTGIVTLLSDAERCKTLADQGRELVETTYHWERVEPEYLRLYEQLE